MSSAGNTYIRVLAGETPPAPTLSAPPPAAAAHSLSALMVISRQMMSTTGAVMKRGDQGAGGDTASSTSAVATLEGHVWGARWLCWGRWRTRFRYNDKQLWR